MKSSEELLEQFGMKPPTPEQGVDPGITENAAKFLQWLDAEGYHCLGYIDPNDEDYEDVQLDIVGEYIDSIDSDSDELFEELLNWSSWYGMPDLTNEPADA